MKLKFLVIGLGSMGKRRIRNLISLGYNFIDGVDFREDRCKETNKLYGIKTYHSFEKAVKNNRYNAIIISVPPDFHDYYIEKALNLRIPTFIEASVINTNYSNYINEINKTDAIISPSCTLFFHPAIKKIKEIIENMELGKISNIIYHSGQYLPDWHVYEKVEDYYVSKRITGGAREIVPFELTWLTMLFGLPSRVSCFHKKTIEISGAEEIDDTYNLILDYEEFMMSLTVDVVSRCATRRLTINGDKAQLNWDWEDTFLKVYYPENKNWEIISFEMLKANEKYNSNITESMYIDEIESFINHFKKINKFPNSLEHDNEVLNILYQAEKSNTENKTKSLKF